MEKYQLLDLINNDMLHICKRMNNKKRDYLFVNKFQCKHIPVAPSMFYGAVDELYKKAFYHLYDKKKILVVGFAETATAIGELFFEKCLTDEHKLDVVEYIHTTREDISGKNYIAFEEEHSHATSQRIYLNKQLDYDCIVFVEDEITTGNTILNFINEFNKVKSINNYFVLSFANWQSRENKEKFENNGVVAISLVDGEIKDPTYKLDVEVGAIKDFTGEGNYEHNCYSANSGFKSAREGIKETELMNGHNIVNFICDKVSKGDKLEIVGTEEFMMVPIRIAHQLEELEYDVECHSTTRSPIQVSPDCIITDGVKLTSAYEKERVNYLYNLENRNYNKVFVITERIKNLNFIDEITEIYKSVGIKKEDIVFIEM